MSWFRCDDKIAFGAKHLAAGNEAIGAWVRAGAWCSAHLTDGFVPTDVALSIAPKRVWKKLIDAKAGHEVGLVVARDDGYQLHDYLAYNPSAAKVRAEREAWAIRQGRARESRRDAQGDSSTDSRAGHPWRPSVSPGVPFPIPDPEASSSASGACTRVADGVPDEGSEIAPEEPQLKPVAPAPQTSLAEIPSAPPGPDFLTMAARLAEAGKGYGREMLDWAARQKRFTAPQRAKIQELYAELLEGQANAERARAAKAELDTGPSTSRSPAGAAQAESDAFALWSELWGRQHGGEAYPVTDRDRGAMRKLVARAQARAKEVGCERFRDVLGHYLGRYLAIDDRRLVAERYPLTLLESRMSAIGDYQAVKARASRVAPAPEPAGTPAPPEARAAFANLKFMAPAPRPAGGPS